MAICFTQKKNCNMFYQTRGKSIILHNTMLYKTVNAKRLFQFMNKERVRDSSSEMGEGGRGRVERRERLGGKIGGIYTGTKYVIGCEIIYKPKTLRIRNTTLNNVGCISAKLKKSFILLTAFSLPSSLSHTHT